MSMTEDQQHRNSHIAEMMRKALRGVTDEAPQEHSPMEPAVLGMPRTRKLQRAMLRRSSLKTARRSGR